MKILIMLSFIFISLRGIAQNSFYMIGGPDSYHVLNNQYGFPSAYGLHTGLQYIIADKVNSVYFGMEAVFQHRREFISNYHGGNSNILHGDAFFASNNLQFTPFIRWKPDPLFVEAGPFVNFRLPSDQSPYSLASPFDFGVAGALGVRFDKVNLSFKLAYELYDINQYQFGFNPPNYNSLNLSINAGTRLNGAHNK